MRRSSFYWTLSNLVERPTVCKVVRLRSPGQRAGLTRAHVLVAARDLLVERGLEALTMRTLAERLGVSPNALYSHVSRKTALVDDLLDDALATVQTPSPDARDPIAGVHALMASTYQVLLAHADLVPLYLARQGARGPNAQHLGDVMLALLSRADVTGPSPRGPARPHRLHNRVRGVCHPPAVPDRRPRTTHRRRPRHPLRPRPPLDPGRSHLTAVSPQGEPQASEATDAGPRRCRLDL